MKYEIQFMHDTMEYHELIRYIPQRNYDCLGDITSSDIIKKITFTDFQTEELENYIKEKLNELQQKTKSDFLFFENDKKKDLIFPLSKL